MTTYNDPRTAHRSRLCSIPFIVLLARRWLQLCTMCLTALTALPQPADAQDDVDALVREFQSESLEGTLAVLSFIGIPDDGAGGLYIRSRGDSDEFNFSSFQVGGGFALGPNSPLYVEGYFGLARYRPTLIVSPSAVDAELEFKWTSVAVTGGFGGQFDLSEHWKFRPLAHLSFGRAQSDVSIGAQLAAELLDVDEDFLEIGGIWAGGYGASGTFAYDRRFTRGHRVEARIRASYLRYEPLSDDLGLVGSSTATQVGAWTRLRIPTGRKALGRPLLGITDASISYLGGDQTKVLRSDWIGKVGLGLELDLEDSGQNVISAARFLVRFFAGENLEGVSVGAGVSF